MEEINWSAATNFCNRDVDRLSWKYYTRDINENWFLQEIFAMMRLAWTLLKLHSHAKRWFTLYFFWWIWAVLVLMLCDMLCVLTWLCSRHPINSKTSVCDMCVIVVSAFISCLSDTHCLSCLSECIWSSCMLRCVKLMFYM